MRARGCSAWLFAAALAAAAPGARAQSNDDCLGCHSDPSLTGTRGGKTISVGVDAKKLAGSVHGSLDCIACHQDLAGSEFPHTENPKRVECGACHDQQAKEYARNIHGVAAAKGDKLAPGCTECHGKHDILPRRDPRSPTATMNIPVTCGRCHHEGTPVSLSHDIPQDRILENYSMSQHGEGLYKRGLTVTAVCTSCHTAHDVLPHTDPRSSINRANIAKTCTQCHARIEMVHRKVIEGRLWQEAPNKIPVCIDCHSPHKVRRLLYPEGMADKDCLVCHGKKDLTAVRDGKTVSLYVDEDARLAASHGKTACAQCHTEVAPSHVRPCETIKSKVDCSICHAEVVATYRGSIHGQLAAKNDVDAPRCLDCHDRHATQSKRLPTSKTYPRNVPELCATCHRSGEKAAVRIKAEGPNPVQSYKISIHGKGLLDSGLVVTATCADCHTAHGELPPADPRSTVNRMNLPATCGRCHRGIQEIFVASIHWPGRTDAKDPSKLPTCEDCHSSHSISRTDRADFRFRMMDQCGRCHQSEAATFFDTYHGKVSRLGNAGAAKCYDCHGTHDILPAVNPASHLSRQNVVKTCGQCHAGAHRRFAGYLTHATHHDRHKYPFLFAAFWGMTALLIGTLFFAALHTAAWLWRLWRTRHAWRAHRAAPAGQLHRRFNRRQRMLHLAMMLSFFTLALTGMTLKFSYAPWADVVSTVLGGSGAMGVLHRIAAVTLIVVFVLHLLQLRRQKREAGLSWWKFVYGKDTILFKWNDLRELIGSLKWFLGRGPRPAYGRYTYWEKFDYFAVLWGILIIGSTGLVLWFPEFFTRLLPGWSVNVATIIHSDEALLAVGFIFTVHFFNTHFRPDKFPMDPVIFTGRVPLEELKYDKPREYEDLVAAGKLEEKLVDPIPVQAEKGFRIFGFIALGIGLSLIALIVYAMIFAYR